MSESKILGEGTYGIVYEIEDGKALKQNIIEKEISFMGSLKELEMLSRLKNHPCIVSLLDTRWGSIKNIKSEEVREDLIHFIFEKADYDLHSYIHEQKGSIPEKKIIEISYQMLLACEYMHRVGIIHRDIKPGNVLIFKKGSNTTAKICDFGMCSSPHSSSMKTPNVYTSSYRAPEIYMENEYDSKADIWAIGATIYEMITRDHLVKIKENTKTSVMKALSRRIPFHRSYWSRKGKIDREFFPEGLSKIFDTNMRELLSMMLHWDPNQRCTAIQALSHKVFDPYRKKINTILTNYNPKSVDCEYEKPRRSKESDRGYDLGVLCIQKKSDLWSNKAVFLGISIYERTLVSMSNDQSEMNDISIDITFLTCMYIAVKYYNTMYSAISFQEFVYSLFEDNCGDYLCSDVLEIIESLEYDIVSVGLEYEIYAITPYDKLEDTSDENCIRVIEKMKKELK
jgi:glycogen synthase kinase 3 beta